MFSRDAVIIRTRKAVDLYEFNYDMNINDIGTAQGYAQIWSHIDCVNRYKIKLFVELGVYMGGTLPYLIPNLMLDDSFKYLGFEILSGTVKPQIMAFSESHPRCQIIIDDMFNHLKLVEDAIRDAGGPVYIFCDGGNKPKELLTFSKLMRRGDIISVHDWTEDQSGEITDRDIAKLGDEFAPLDEAWRWGIVWLPTFMKVK